MKNQQNDNYDSLFLDHSQPLEKNNQYQKEEDLLQEQNLFHSMLLPSQVQGSLGKSLRSSISKNPIGPHKKQQQQPFIQSIKNVIFPPEPQDAFIEKQKKVLKLDHEKIHSFLKNVKQFPTQQSQDSILKLELRSQFQMIQLFKDKSQQISGIISVKPISQSDKLDEQLKQERAGVDLFCLIDKSGSMEGEKIEVVKQALLILLNYMSENDRLQLITFDSFGERLTGLERVTDDNKEYFQNQIFKIEADGYTNISSATQIAFQEMKSRTKRNNATSIFLLSDGDDSQAERLVKQQLQSLDIDEIFTLHSFGFGEDHDANMMISLCNLGHGSFYFVQNITLLDEFFIDALGGLMSVIGEQLEITVKCSPQQPFQDISIYKTYGQMWNQTKLNREYFIKQPYLISGLRKDFVFELNFPLIDFVIQDHQRQGKVIEVELKIIDSKNGQLIHKKEALQLTFYNEGEIQNQGQEDIEVQIQYYRVKAAYVIDDARRACEQNRFEEAQQMIDRMLFQVTEHLQLSKEFEATISDLQQARKGSEKHSYNIYGSNQMRQLVRNTMQQQGINSIFISGNQMESDVSELLYSNPLSRQMLSQVQQQRILRKE